MSKHVATIKCTICIVYEGTWILFRCIVTQRMIITNIKIYVLNLFHSLLIFLVASVLLNLLAPNDIFVCRTAQLTSRRCILNIYSTNILTEYFKHAAHSPFFSSRCRLFHNAIFFGSYNIHILNTECAKILKKILVPKG